MDKNTTRQRIMIGQHITICGQVYRVAARERGRSGEERTVYVLERQRKDGTWYRSETRGRANLLLHMDAV